MNTSESRKTRLMKSNTFDFKRQQGQSIQQINLAGDHSFMGQQHGHQVRRLKPLILAAMEELLMSLSEIQFDIQPIIEEIMATCEM